MEVECTRSSNHLIHTAFFLHLMNDAYSIRLKVNSSQSRFCIYTFLLKNYSETHFVKMLYRDMKLCIIIIYYFDAFFF